jgi:hypothetical protein
MEGFKALEQQILRQMARADRERRTMEQQLEAARVVAREYTRAGRSAPSR